MTSTSASALTTPLPGCVQSPSAPARGFDTDSPVSAAAAAAMFADGYRFCVRYLSRGAESQADLSRIEAAAILEAGLALMPVQHVAASGWCPDAQLGSEYGARAGANAQALGFPAGINVWCDLEGCGAQAGVAGVLAYCKAWYAAVAEQGYVPGLYVGASSVLDGQELYADLPFRHYWKSESHVDPVAQRGYQMVQSPLAGTVYGMSIDLDLTQADQLGGQVLWLAPHPVQ